MAEFDPPSFSLGLDLGTDPDPDPDPLELQVMDSEEEEELGAHQEPPRKVLKRLRRGHVAGRREERTASGFGDVSEGGVTGGGDDEIEEFSSQEEDLVIDACPSRHFNSVCSSSKVPLRGSGIFTASSSSHWKRKRKEPTSDAPASSTLEAGHKGLMFPKLTVSPLRRFQLIDSDSDSDEPLKSEVLKSKDQAAVASSMMNSSTSVEQTRNTKQQNEDLWKDFLPMKSSRVATPVLDEVCDEYFRSLQNRNVAQKQGNDNCRTGSGGCQLKEISKTGIGQTWNEGEHYAPAHLYFFNNDPKIRSLVRSRLPYFSPLPMGNNTGNQLPNESAIDYIAQFNGNASRPLGSKRSNSGQDSASGGKKPQKSTVQKTSQGWVDPKSSSSKPKNVGKRRVHASGEAAAGHWYTSQEGKKVYVSKSGQEFSGQGAYRCYRKESGGSRRSKKKTSSKRKRG